MTGRLTPNVFESEPEVWTPGSTILEPGRNGSDPQSSIDLDPTRSGAQCSDVGVEHFAGPTNLSAVSIASPSGQHLFDELRVLAECFEDAQQVRIGMENRLRSGSVPADLATRIVTGARDTEHELAKGMRRAFKRAAPEIHEWTKNTVGLGEHLMARLLGAIGHPVHAYPHHWEGEGSARVLVADPPFERNVAKLWAYCGHGDPSRRRAKGMTQNDALALGSPRAKLIVHLLAESAMKCVGTAVEDPQPRDSSPSDLCAGVSEAAVDAQSSPDRRHHHPDDESRIKSQPKARPTRRRSPYRDVYEIARAKYDGRDDWAPAHQHAAALRLVGKSILRDLWVVARGGS